MVSIYKQYIQKWETFAVTKSTVKQYQEYCDTKGSSVHPKSPRMILLDPPKQINYVYATTMIQTPNNTKSYQQHQTDWKSMNELKRNQFHLYSDWKDCKIVYDLNSSKVDEHELLKSIWDKNRKQWDRDRKKNNNNNKKNNNNNKKKKKNRKRQREKSDLGTVGLPNKRIKLSLNVKVNGSEMVANINTNDTQNTNSSETNLVNTNLVNTNNGNKQYRNWNNDNKQNIMPTSNVSTSSLKCNDNNDIMRTIYIGNIDQSMSGVAAYNYIISLIGYECIGYIKSIDLELNFCSLQARITLMDCTFTKYVFGALTEHNMKCNDSDKPLEVSRFFNENDKNGMIKYIISNGLDINDDSYLKSELFKYNKLYKDEIIEAILAITKIHKDIAEIIATYIVLNGLGC